RTRHDHHAFGLERAGGDRRAHVALAVDHAGERAHLLDGVAGLVLERALRPFADDEVGFDGAALERLEHPHAEDGAGRAGHADDETPHSVSSATAGSRARYDSKRTKPLRLQAHLGRAPGSGARIARKGLSPIGAFTRSGLEQVAELLLRHA